MCGIKWIDFGYYGSMNFKAMISVIDYEASVYYSKPNELKYSQTSIISLKSRP